MSHETFLAIARFENRNGVISWRVTGSINGVRVRRNFKSQEEAAAEKAALEIRSAQATAGMRSALTFFSDERLREAEDAFRKLGGRTRSLLFYLATRQEGTHGGWTGNGPQGKALAGRQGTELCTVVAGREGHLARRAASSLRVMFRIPPWRFSPAPNE